ncbi:hypothetical protein NB636_08070 [Oxalobacter aliiformigenes]|uniref:hypothetical protein n=1 Tax=Oxalobacter aliiformigenes TaxID=2946593 RepID=UPI0022AEC417|nr:hypothetical protein [Oxalobacter aliiformigenes]MCZ4065705.1 hypothetical protein [Oxalobacter aliiformigenes]WAV98663.1 hypothetical protein NB636_08070 [Oxalobacter aliiformigenes]
MSVLSLNNHVDASQTLTPDQCHEIRRAIWQIGSCFLDRESVWIYNHLRVEFQVERWPDIPRDHFPIVMELIKGKAESVRQFHQAILEMRSWFARECLGGGCPWTPAIKARLNRDLRRSVVPPPRIDWLVLANTSVTAQREDIDGK